MSRNYKTIVLKQYRDVLNYFKDFEQKEEISTNEKSKILILTKPFRGKQLKVG